MSQFTNAQLTPQARVVDSYAAPIVAPPSNKGEELAQLAQGLSQFSSGLKRYENYANEQKRQELTEQIKADAADKYKNMQEFQAAVDAKKIAYQDVPWAISDLKAAVARNQALANSEKAYEGYLQDPTRFNTVDEVRAYAYEMGQVGMNGDDPVVVSAAADVIQRASAALVETHIRGRSEARQEEMKAALENNVLSIVRLASRSPESVKTLNADLKNATDNMSFLPPAERQKAVERGLRAAALSFENTSELETVLNSTEVEGKRLADTADGKVLIADLLNQTENRIENKANTIQKVKAIKRQQDLDSVDTDFGNHLAQGGSPESFKISKERLTQIAPENRVDAILRAGNVAVTLNGINRTQEGQEVTTAFLGAVAKDGQAALDTVYPKTGETYRDVLIRTGTYGGVVNPALAGVMADAVEVNDLTMRAGTGDLSFAELKEQERRLSPSDFARLQRVITAYKVPTSTGLKAFQDSLKGTDNIVYNSIEAKMLEGWTPPLAPGMGESREDVVGKAKIESEKAKYALAFEMGDFARLPPEQQTTEEARKRIWSVVQRYGGHGNDAEYLKPAADKQREAAKAVTPTPTAKTSGENQNSMVILQTRLAEIQGERQAIFNQPQMTQEDHDKLMELERERRVTAGRLAPLTMFQRNAKGQQNLRSLSSTALKTFGNTGLLGTVQHTGVDSTTMGYDPVSLTHNMWGGHFLEDLTKLPSTKLELGTEAIEPVSLGTRSYNDFVTRTRKAEERGDYASAKALLMHATSSKIVVDGNTLEYAPFNLVDSAEQIPGFIESRRELYGLDNKEVQTLIDNMRTIIMWKQASEKRNNSAGTNAKPRVGAAFVGD